MKKIIILAIAIMMSIGAYAGEDSFRDRVENWLSGNEDSGALRGAIGGSDNVAGGETTIGDSPVGDGLFLLSLFAAGYAVVNKRRKKLILESASESPMY